MKLDFASFDETSESNFLRNLSKVSGCAPENIVSYSFSSGCVIFEGDLEKEAAELIYENYLYLNKLKKIDEVVSHLTPLKKFISEYKITEISNGQVTSVNIQLKECIEDKNAIFFVHGWRGTPNSFGLLPKFLSESIGCETKVFHYPTTLTGDSPSLHYLSANLDNWIRSNIRSDKRRIALVGHSMGGIVIRKMLLGQLHRATPLTEKLNQVTFVASPYTGVWIAKLARRLPILGQTQPNQISPDSSILLEINSQWLYWKRKNKRIEPYIRSIYGTADAVVDPTIAAVDDPDAIPIIGAGHINIVKPKKPNDEIVATIERLMLESGLNQAL